MNNEIKQKWIAALRSGEYEQGFGALRIDEEGKTKFCCLGVLCVITPGVELFEPSPNLSADRIEYGFKYKGDYSYSFLPDPLANDIDLPVFFSKDTITQSQLALFNDANDPKKENQEDLKGKSFAEIADWIEENL